MNTKRVLLSCTVISLQDSGFVYPCCQFCLSRLIPESNSRSRCPKCGTTYDAQNVDYRFRLSLKVSRDTSLFGVTVFGGCLNPFFGITAVGLQRFLESEKFEGQQSLQQLLIKAVEDCFIGKCLVFGFKLSGRDAESCLLGQHIAESVRFVACQVIPPHGAFVGVTVFAYLQSLMQANTHSDCSLKAGGHWQQTDSPASSFDHTLPLCLISHSESSNETLTPPHPWHSVSDLILCFSPEETSRCSLTEVSVDSESQVPLALQLSNGLQGANTNPSQSQQREQNRCSNSHEFRFNALSGSPIITTPCDKHFERQALEASLIQLNDSLSERPLFNRTSLFLEDAPLSETLGDFVSIEIVNQNVLSPTSKIDQAKPENSVLSENNAIPKYTSKIQSSHSSLPVLTPLRDVTNNRVSLKRKNRRHDASTSSKDVMKLSQVSEGLLFCDKKDVASTRTGGTHVQHHATIVQENQSSGYEDDYNCSADLFHQNSMDILDVDQRKHDRLPYINNSEPTFTSFHFAPSLQSTPIVDPSIQFAYRQRRKLGKKRSRTSHISFLQNHTINKPMLQVVKSAGDRTCRSDSALETSESSAGGSEPKVNVKPVTAESAFPNITNDCSRDLFDTLF
ncbi:DNA damage-induced apoptosis suppressor protein isoform X1 [Silurus asotus]|uniref:DNA damage-induced apoptosis suppressor protein isoform X1 n=1 Tax=Silurus asotus TaxID=30991 RepID=A0AAD5AUU7_SILAS|nr:DNA damage-induced apoptosis suppressor protein isoform X1 [Silurus asotus]